MGQRMAPPAPGGEQEMEAPEPGEGGGDIGSLLENLAKGLQILDETVSGAGATPELSKKITGIKDQFMAVIQEIGQGGAPQGPGGAAQPASMEGGPDGVPMNPAMR